MKVFNFNIEILTAPFTLLFRSNAAPNQNKNVKPIVVLLISLAVVVALVFAYYYGVIFKWKK